MNFKKLTAFITSAVMLMSCFSAVYSAEGADPVRTNDVFSSDVASIADYSVTSGYTLSDEKGIQYTSVGVYNIISNQKTTGSDFLLETTLQRQFNWHYLYINYKDDKNYTEIALNSTMKVTNVVNGNSTDVATIDNSDNFNWKEIKVKLFRRSGKLKLIIGNKTYFEGIEDTNAIDGRFGVRFASCPSYIKNFKVSNLLHVTDNSLSGESVHKVDDDITISFDYDIDATTLTKNNMYISGPAGKISDLSYELIPTESDGVTITFNEALEHNTDYKLIITDGLHIDTLSHGLGGSEEITFKTEPYPFLTELKTENLQNGIGAWVEIENNFFTEKEAVITVSSEKADGTTAKSFEPETIVIDEAKEKSTAVTIPADSYFENVKYFVWDLRMHRAFPELISYPDSSGFKASAAVTGDMIKISGITPSEGAGKTITFIMGNPDEEVSFDIAPSKIAEVITGEGGNFCIEFPIKDKDTSGDYFYKIGGDDFKEPYDGTFYYASAYDKNRVTGFVNSVFSNTELTDEKKIDEIAELITSAEEKLSLTSDIYKEVGAEKIAKILLSEYGDTQFDETDAAVELKESIDMAGIVAAYNESLINLLADYELLLVNEDIYSFADFDDLNDTSAYAAYEKMSYQARESVMNALTGKSYTNINDIYVDFVKNVILYGIKGMADGGTAHIYELLSKNSAFVGMDISEYLKLDRTIMVDEELLNTEFTTLSELETKIYELAKNVDPSIVSYDFKEETKDINWIIESPSTSAAFDGDMLTVPATASMGIITKDKYEAPVQLSVNMNHSYNYRNIIFAYQDSQNYCYIDPTSSAGVLLYKVTGGEKVLIGTYEYPLSTKSYVTFETEITIKPDFSIDIVFIHNDARLEVAKNVKDDAFGIPGGFGAKFINSSGNISKVKASMYPTVKQSNLTDSFSVTDDAEFEFNFELNPETVTKDAITVIGSDGKEVDFDLSLDGKYITLDFVGELNYKSEYKIEFEKSIELLKRECQMYANEIYTFKTEEPKIDITELYGLADGNEVYRQDTDCFNGEITESIRECDGKTLDLYVKLKNNTTTSGAVFVAMLVDENLVPLSVKTTNLSFPAYKSGYINESTGTLSDTASPAMSFSIPNGALGKYRIEYMLIDSESNMKLLYPYTEAEKVTSGENVPSYSMMGNKITVFGKSDSGRAGGKVSGILYTPNKSAKLGIFTATTDKNGDYSAELMINYDLLNVSGGCELKVGGAELNGTKSISINIALPGDKAEAIRQINAASSVTETVSKISQYKDLLGFGSYKRQKSDNPFNRLAGLTSLAQMLMQGDYKTDDDGVEINEYVLLYSAICAYNQGLSDYVYTSSGEFALSDIFSFSEADTGTVNAYSIYENDITDAGKAAVRVGILGGNCMNKADILKLFIQQVVISDVNNNKLDGYGHIHDLLMNNGTAAGLDLAKYKTLKDTSAVDMAICRANVKTIEDINNILKNIKTNSNQQQGNTSSGGITGGGGGGSGSGGSKTPNISIATDVVPESQSYSVTSGFTDLSGFEWAVEAVGEMARRSVVSGRGDGTFDPAGTITREEFAKILVLAFGITPAEKELPFTDVADDAWYNGYIAAAYSSGIINGISDTEFGVGDKVTRQDAATLIFRTLKVLGKADEGKTDVLVNFADSEEISDYAKEALGYMITTEYMKGVGDRKIAPKSNSNRAEIVTLIYRIVK